MLSQDNNKISKSDQEISTTSVIKSYNNTTYEWLCSEFPDFGSLDINAYSTLIVGKPQAGKSEFAFGIALMAILQDKIPIMILRNFSKDAVQMQSKIKRFALRHAQFMNKMGFGSKIALKSIFANSIEMKGTKKLILTLYNGYQLNVVKKLTQDMDYILLVDEADAIGYSEIKEEDERPKHHAPIEYQQLLKNTKQIYEISATVFDILYGNTTLTNNNIVVVRPPPTYKGIKDGIQFIPFKEKITRWTKDMCIHEADPNIHLVYEELSKVPIFLPQRYSCPLDHPVIILHKANVFHYHHDMLLENFIKGESLRDAWTVIIEDSRAIQLYNINLIGRKIRIMNETFEDTKNNGMFLFTSKSIDIQCVLQWLIDNGGATKFHHILIKTGRQAGRSRSYVSSDGNWHLTHEYYSPSKSGRNAADLVQAVRLCHNRPDSIPLTIFAPITVCEDLQKADTIQEEQLQRLRTLPNSISTSEHVKVDVWTDKKVPKYRLCKQKVNKHFRLTKVKGNDGGWGIEFYESKIIRETNQEINKETSKYLIIDQNKFKANSVVSRMIADVEKILIDQDKMNKDVEIVWVNNHLQKITQWQDKSLDGIHGSLWTTIRKNKSLISTDEKIPNSLLYWKKGAKGYACLT